MPSRRSARRSPWPCTPRRVSRARRGLSPRPRERYSMATTIAIIDYGAGNLRSIQKALAHVAAESGAGGLTVVVTANAETVERADAVVLPGVGAAGATMR